MPPKTPGHAAGNDNPGLGALPLTIALAVTLAACSGSAPPQ